MTRSEIITYLERYIERFHLPVRYGIRVERVERNETSGLYRVWTSDGGQITARNVVIATGLYQTPKVPTFSAVLRPNIRQVHSDVYRDPVELFPGAVLVVGSAQSGAQIAEELYEAGKKVYLAAGPIIKTELFGPPVGVLAAIAPGYTTGAASGALLPAG